MFYVSKINKTRNGFWFDFESKSTSGSDPCAHTSWSPWGGICGRWSVQFDTQTRDCGALAI